MSSSRCGHGPGEGPTVGVKHWKGPEITISTSHRLMQHRAHRIHPGIAMSDHHSFRTRGGAAGIIDREQISLANFWSNKLRRTHLEKRFVIDPIFPFTS